MNENKKEIRRILSGFFEDNGNALVAAESVLTSGFKSVFSGAVSARFLGITEKKLFFKSHLSEKELAEACKKAFADMGRAVELKTVPDVIAVLVFRVLFNPCIITAKVDGNKLLLTFYTARTLFSFFNARVSIAQFLKKMPAESLEVAQLPAEETVKKGRRFFASKDAKKKNADGKNQKSKKKNKKNKK